MALHPGSGFRLFIRWEDPDYQGGRIVDVPADKTGTTVTIIRPDDTIAATISGGSVTDEPETGVYSIGYIIPADAPLGRWRWEATCNGGGFKTHYLIVEART